MSYSEPTPLKRKFMKHMDNCQRCKKGLICPTYQQLSYAIDVQAKKSSGTSQAKAWWKR